MIFSDLTVEQWHKYHKNHESKQLSLDLNGSKAAELKKLRFCYLPFVFFSR